MQRGPRLLTFAAASGFIACCAFILAYFVVHAAAPRAPAAPLLAMILLASLPILGWIGKWALGPRGFVAAALTLAALSSMIALGVQHALSEPLIHASPQWCGTGRVMFEMTIPPAMLLAGAVLGLFSALVVTREGPGFDRKVHALVKAAAAIAAVLTIAATIRAARRPDTDHYMQSLPIVATVRAALGTPVVVPAEARRPNRRDAWQGPVNVYDAEVDDVILRRVCHEHQCRVGLVQRDTPVEDELSDGWEIDDDKLVQVRRDPARLLWLVRTHGDRPYQGSWLQRFDVHARDVARSVSPPRGWIIGAAFGLALAGAAYLFRRDAVARRSAILGGRAGTLDASGLITVEGDEHPLRAAPRQALDVGPVVVLPGPVAPGGVYRGDAAGAGARVACGTSEALLAAADARIANLDAFALAALALTVAPLVVAVMHGIVI